MKAYNPSGSYGLRNVADDAEALLAVTADAVEANVLHARKRLTTALEQGRDELKDVREGANEIIRGHPYESIGVGFGLGAVLGFLITRHG